ncbi:coatomer WD associated region-domain-containing protein [Catenaria anguillulae PL171]|uniref:Coatomer subunit alpha n=1 Tax=Catenaria anguillulae PL171 TaxID=765915 RepID=A0A1Y2I1F0_9FUNG|nr:coatomer WD associated region-domain-containing protein [Catenaria anguillulae PL171]
MLTKFESKSNRVKGLAFHPKRPWILASLHNGSIQWWDYRMGTLLDRFDEHEVRAVAFHPSQPLFVSGGDDYKLRVWNHKQRRCLFTLHGHLDFVRTVQFHHEAPWIVSASDDYTIRIWNWQSRSCLAVLTGHHHYVMSAFFHPSEDLIVSASYDFTIRARAGAIGMGGMGMGGMNQQAGGMSAFNAPGGPLGGRSGPDTNNPGTGADLFGTSDAVVKYVLEGHDKCVNWAQFHPTLPLIVSGGDDRQIKIWRMSETKAWEVDTFRGHFNNVSATLFHPRAELILSAAEDKTIRVWDMSKRVVAQTFRREHDRFWVLVAHPHINLFAAGHDSGLIVFKLERERPAMHLHQTSLVYVKDKHLCTYDIATGAEASGALVKRGSGVQPSPRTLSYNPTERLAAVTVAVPGTQGNDGAMVQVYSMDRGQEEPIKLSGHAAVFVARNRLAVLDKAAGVINLYDTRGTKLKDMRLANGATEMFYAGIGKVLVSTGTAVELWDVQQGVQVGELGNVNNVKYAVFSADMTQVALLSKHVITLANAHTLQQLAVVHETIRVKSAVFDGAVLVYTTLNHIKYALPNGDNGILCTLDHPLYLVHVAGDHVLALSRDQKMLKLRVDGTEYRFKLALILREYNQVLHIIQNANLLGQSIIAYLQKKGYPDVALHFVQDPATRLDLALECGQLDAALAAAESLASASSGPTASSSAAWTRLAKAATRQGNVLLAELAMQKVKNLAGLSLLYLVTGQQEKLAKMLAIAQHRGDAMAQMHNAVLLGSVEDRARVLAEAGLTSLAWLTCQTHGLTGVNVADVQGAVNKVRGDKEPELLNWPVVETNQGYFAASSGVPVDPAVAQVASAAAATMAAGGAAAASAATADDVWGGAAANASEQQPADEADWGFDLDIPTVPVAGNTPGAISGSVSPTAGAASSTASDLTAALSSLPAPGPNKKSSWIRSGANVRALDHIVAGSFDTAMAVLSRTTGISHFAALRPAFLTAHAAAAAHLPTGTGGSLEVAVSRNWADTSDPLKSQAVVPVTVESVLGGLAAEAGKLTMQATRVPEALEMWRAALHALALIADDPAAMPHVATMREQVEAAGTDARRNVELAVYFAQAELDPAHARLAGGYLVLAAHFARRLLDMNPPPTVAQRCTQLIALADAQPPNPDLPPVDFDPFNPLPVCAASMEAVHGAHVGKCRFCKAAYKPEFAGSVCVVCLVAVVVA